MKAKVTYRGWPGHFCCGTSCVFHLNTLIEFRDKKVVVSTVGMMKNPRIPGIKNESEYGEIGCNRYYETMAFYAQKEKEFWDADVSREINFESNWAYGNIKDEWAANKGHWKVVDELVNKLELDQPLTAEESADTEKRKCGRSTPNSRSKKRLK